MVNVTTNTQTEFPNKTKIFYKSPTNLLFLFAIIIIIIISCLSVFQFYNLLLANRWVAHTYQVLLTTDEALYQITYMESRQRAFLLFNEKAVINDLDETRLKIKKSLDVLLDLTADNPAQHARSEKFAALVNQRIKILNILIQIKLNNKLSSPEALTLFNQGQLISEATKLSANEITEVELVLLQERNDTAIKDTGLTNLIFIGGQVVSITFLLLSFILFNRELSIRRHTEIRANNTKSQLISIIEEANDMIAALDLDRRFIIFNEAYKKEFKRLFGKQIVLGMKIDDALSHVPEVKNKLLESWQQSLQGHEYTKNIEIDSKDTHNVYEVTSSLIKNAQHEIIGAVHIIRNISKRVQEQNTLKESYEKLNKGMDELKSKNEKITLLLEMSDVMLACHSTQELSNITVKFFSKILNFSSGIFYIIKPSGNILETSATWGTPTSQTNNFIQDQCWALRLDHLHQAGFSNNELVCNHVKITPQKNIIYLCVPLKVQNDTLGLLYIEILQKNREQNQLKSEELLLINAFSELAALALANVRLRENLQNQSIRDPLTALYNRRHLEEFLSKQIYQSERNKLPIAILILDIDHFKKVNDIHGHLAGDLVLKEFGQLLLKNIRPGDIASRYGGEEFVIILYNTNAKIAKERAETIRKDVALMKNIYEGHDLGELTVSIGIAVYPQDGKSELELIELADKALYFAKNDGRNKVVLSSEIQSS